VLLPALMRARLLMVNEDGRMLSGKPRGAWEISDLGASG